MQHRIEAFSRAIRPHGASGMPRPTKRSAIHAACRGRHALHYKYLRLKNSAVWEVADHGDFLKSPGELQSNSLFTVLKENIDVNANG